LKWKRDTRSLSVVIDQSEPHILNNKVI